MDIKILKNIISFREIEMQTDEKFWREEGGATVVQDTNYPSRGQWGPILEEVVLLHLQLAANAGQR